VQRTLVEPQEAWAQCIGHHMPRAFEQWLLASCERHVGGTTTAAVMSCRQACGNVVVIGKDGCSDGMGDGHALEFDGECHRAAALFGWDASGCEAWRR